MATSGRREKPLSIDSIPKKYRGEPEDPHFIPKSPILSRQCLSAQEEDDLRRACELALTGIPCSDATENDNYLLQLAQQITVNPIQETIHQRQKSQESSKSISKTGQIAQRAKSRNDESVTPSNNSQRDRSVRSNTSTPLTSAAPTPADTTKRFFESMERPPTAHQPVSIHHHKTPLKQMAYAFLNEPATAPTIRIVRPGSRSMTSLPMVEHDIDAVPTPERDIGPTTSLPGQYNIYNKSLPDLPQTNTEVSHTSMTIFDFGRLHGRQTAFKNVNTTGSIPVQIQRSHTTPPNKPSKKRIFRIFSLFNKKKRQTHDL